MTWEECLAQLGTVAYLGSIPRKYLESFTIIGDWDYIDKYVINKKSEYWLDYQQLQAGRGKGKRVKAMDMMEREAEFNRNLTWIMKDRDLDNTIIEFSYDNDLDKLSCAFTTSVEGDSSNE